MRIDLIRFSQDLSHVFLLIEDEILVDEFLLPRGIYLYLYTCGSYCKPVRVNLLFVYKCRSLTKVRLVFLQYCTLVVHGMAFRACGHNKSLLKTKV